MKKFEFRFDKVINLREQREKEKEIALAEAQRELSRALEELEILKGRSRACMTKMKIKRESKNISTEEMERYYQYLMFMQEMITKQKSVIAHAEKNVDMKRQQLLTASRETKKLQNLKEKKHGAYQIELTRKEQDHLDDLASVFQSRIKEEKAWQ